MVPRMQVVSGFGVERGWKKTPQAVVITLDYTAKQPGVSYELLHVGGRRREENSNKMQFLIKFYDNCNYYERSV